MNTLVNNINLHYEVYGKGKPIILLHGNQNTYKIFNKLIEKLRDSYKVYAIDSRCHGTSENSKKISYNLMRDDIICFIKKLKIKKPILYGFSDGGIIGLLIAIKEKHILKKLIISGPNLNPRGFKKYMLLFSKLSYLFTRNKLFKLMVKEPNISINELHEIEVPTILIAGEKDIVKEKHTKLIAQNIRNCKLEIIKKANHSNYVVYNYKLYEILKKYI